MSGTLISPPQIQVMMTGVVSCWKGRETVILTYTDGSRESVKAADMPAVDWDNFFSIVSGVQSLRSKDGRGE